MPSSLPQKILAIFAVIAGLAIGSHGETKSTATPPCLAMQQLGSDVSKELVVYPSQLAFGAHDVGTATVPQEVTLCNNTEKQLDITHAPSPADDFVVSPDCDALTPGVACALGISFRPKPTLPDEFRDVAANLTLTFKIGNDTKTETIPLTGRAALALVAEPNYLSFPPQVIGTTSSLRPIKLTNYKDFPIKLSRFSASTGFAIADRTDCDKLEVKSSCTITISFSPQVKRDVSGVVTVSYGADESTSSTSAGDNSKNSSADNAKKTSLRQIPGTLIVSLQGRGTARPGWTASAPPPASMAVNCSTDVPWELVVLQPVQLVSMEPVPGEMEKLEFEGSAATRTLVQPAATSSAGARSRATALSGGLRRRECAHLSPLLCFVGEATANCSKYGKMPKLSLIIRRGMIGRKGCNLITTYKTPAAPKCDRPCQFWSVFPGAVLGCIGIHHFCLNAW